MRIKFRTFFVFLLHYFDFAFAPLVSSSSTHHVFVSDPSSETDNEKKRTVIQDIFASDLFATKRRFTFHFHLSSRPLQTRHKRRLK